ncbi:MAG TPA: hypothetical protein VFP66_02210 [Candidatus Limnocylindrales bacterium]|nr:hypothetical protein [Candidatus Limnocylindrales bacterium]
MTNGRPPILERDLQDQVLDLARLLGWRVAHFRAARTAHGWRTPVSADGAGFPDLVLIRGRRLVVAELKRSVKNRPTPNQLDWLAAFRAAGVEVYVWTCDDDTESIAQVLR